MCGGPPKVVKGAAASDTGLASTGSSEYGADIPPATDYYSNLMTNGLPYFNQQSQYATSAVGNQVDQAKAAEATKLAGFGGALPSGFAQQENSDIGLGGAQMFDQSILSLLQQQTAAQQAGAAGVTSIGENAGQLAEGANSSILGAAPSLTNSFWSNLIAGIVPALNQSAKTLATAGAGG